MIEGVQRRVRFDGVPSVETRESTQADSPGTLIGYGAVFDSPTDLFRDGTFFEEIAPTAFDEALADRNLDVYGKIQHEGGLMVIGRSTKGTLRLSTDDVGLRYEVDLPDTVAGRDIHTLVSRGDIDGSSFAFSVRGELDTAREVTRPSPGIVNVRWLNLNLYDTGPVADPAYEASTVQARSIDVVREQRDRFLASLEGGDDAAAEIREQAYRTRRARQRNAEATR